MGCTRVDRRPYRLGRRAGGRAGLERPRRQRCSIPLFLRGVAAVTACAVEHRRACEITLEPVDPTPPRPRRAWPLATPRKQAMGEGPVAVWLSTQATDRKNGGTRGAAVCIVSDGSLRGAWVDAVQRLASVCHRPATTFGSGVSSRSKRSRFMTLCQALTKSLTNFSSPSSAA